MAEKNSYEEKGYLFIWRTSLRFLLTDSKTARNWTLHKHFGIDLGFPELRRYAFLSRSVSQSPSLSLQTDTECSTSTYWQRAVLQARLRAGTGPFAAIFCPTKQPSREGNQPGLHCRFVSRSGQWLLTEFSLARLKMTGFVWLFNFLFEWATAALEELCRGPKAKYNDYCAFRPRPWLAVRCVTKKRPPCARARVTVELQWKHTVRTPWSSLA